jgi:hypothetical protein
MKLMPLLSLFAVLALVSCSAPGKPYPLDTCVVSGEKLDSMGKPYVFVKNGQQVKLCCDGCLEDFNKDPDKYLKKIAAKSEAGHPSS